MGREDSSPSPPSLTGVVSSQAKGIPGSSFNPANLRMVTGDLFFAGMATTATTLQWALLLLLLHPSVQREPQEAREGGRAPRGEGEVCT